MEKDSLGGPGSNEVGARASADEGSVRSDLYRVDAGTKDERVDNAPTGLGAYRPRVRYGAWLRGG